MKKLLFVLAVALLLTLGGAALAERVVYEAEDAEMHGKVAVSIPALTNDMIQSAYRDAPQHRFAAQIIDRKDLCLVYQIDSIPFAQSVLMEVIK